MVKTVLGVAVLFCLVQEVCRSWTGSSASYYFLPMCTPNRFKAFILRLMCIETTLMVETK
jgi:hypothetical protein